MRDDAGMAATANNWIPFAGTALGAIIALGGTVLAGVRTDRSQRSRDRESDRLKTYVDFALALDTAHAALGDRGAAEEDGQEVFLRAWRSRDRFDGRSSARTSISSMPRPTCGMSRRKPAGSASVKGWPGGRFISARSWALAMARSCSTVSSWRMTSISAFW